MEFFSYFRLCCNGSNPHWLFLVSARRRALDQSDQLPHLIISDVNMPTLDGFGFLEGVKKNLRTKSIPVIMMTADTKKETREKVIQLGAADFF